jgi:hypothetical protein
MAIPRGTRQEFDYVREYNSRRCIVSDLDYVFGLPPDSAGPSPNGYHSFLYFLCFLSWTQYSAEGKWLMTTDFYTTQQDQISTKL